MAFLARNRADRDGPTADARRGRLYVLAGAALVTVLGLLAACGGSGDDGDDGPGNSPVLTPIDSRYLPLVISDDLALGEQRFQVGLIDTGEDGQEQTPVAGAQLHFKLYLIDQSTGSATEKFETDAIPVVVTKSYTHTHEDGTVETHEAGESGVYISYITFDEAGLWGVQVTGTLADGTNIVGEGEQASALSFPVNEKSRGLAVGDPAPATKQTLASDVADIRSIDTSQNPIPEQHNMTVADAITSGKPTVIAFATPAFCITQLCGPMKEIFDDLYQQYQGQANFLHIEPYQVDKIRDGTCTNYANCLDPAMNDFRLESEPWVFIIDAQGKVAAKYDGIASLEEMSAGLEQVLGG
jgi:hypothetical protein